MQSDEGLHLKKGDTVRQENMGPEFHIHGIARLIGNRFATCQHGGHIFKLSNGEVIPDDEPLFLLRGRDKLALPVLKEFEWMILNDTAYTREQIKYIHALFLEILAEFEGYKKRNVEGMKLPGSSLGR